MSFTLLNNLGIHKTGNASESLTYFSQFFMFWFFLNFFQSETLTQILSQVSSKKLNQLEGMNWWQNISTVKIILYLVEHKRSVCYDNNILITKAKLLFNTLKVNTRLNLWKKNINRAQFWVFSYGPNELWMSLRLKYWYIIF